MSAVNTGSDSNQQQQQQSSSTRTTTAAPHEHTTKETHRKTTLVGACRPMHICDARTTKERSSTEGSGGNTDINHEEEFNSSASASNSIERYRTSPHSRVTTTFGGASQTTPSPSSTTSREGTQNYVFNSVIYLSFSYDHN
jgi:hypothetical protein